MHDTNRRISRFKCSQTCLENYASHSPSRTIVANRYAIRDSMWNGVENNDRNPSPTQTFVRKGHTWIFPRINGLREKACCNSRAILVRGYPEETGGKTVFCKICVAKTACGVDDWSGVTNFSRIVVDNDIKTKYSASFGAYRITLFLFWKRDVCSDGDRQTDVNYCFFRIIYTVKGEKERKKKLLKILFHYIKTRTFDTVLRKYMVYLEAVFYNPSELWVIGATRL